MFFSKRKNSDKNAEDDVTSSMQSPKKKNLEKKLTLSDLCLNHCQPDDKRAECLADVTNKNGSFENREKRLTNNKMEIEMELE